MQLRGNPLIAECRYGLREKGNSLWEAITEGIKLSIQNNPNYGKLTSDGVDYATLPVHLLYEYLTLTNQAEFYTPYGYGIHLNGGGFATPDNPMLNTPFYMLRNAITPYSYKLKLLYFGGVDGKIPHFSMFFNSLVQLNNLFKLVSNPNGTDLIGTLFSLWFDETDGSIHIANNVQDLTPAYQSQLNALKELGGITDLRKWFEVYCYRLEINQRRASYWKPIKDSFIVMPTSVFIPYGVILDIFSPTVEFPLHPLSLWLRRASQLQTLTYPLKVYPRETNFQIRPFDYLEFHEPRYLFVTPATAQQLLTNQLTLYGGGSLTFYKYDFDNNDWATITYTYAEDNDPFQFLLTHGNTYDEILNIPFDKYQELTINQSTTTVAFISNYHHIFLTKNFKLFGNNRMVYIWEADPQNDRFGSFPANIFIGQI